MKQTLLCPGVQTRPLCLQSCVSEGVAKSVCSDSHVPLWTGWLCCSFVVIKVKVACWGRQVSGTGAVSCLMSETGAVLIVL